MIIRKPKKKRIMGKWIIAFWLLSAVGVLLLMPAEASVAKYQQNQQIAAIDRTGTAAETDSSLDVAKIELGDPVGILTIPSISLKLPIYDGTSDKILENGVGITEGTGDITGGNGKNPLISGHSGLYKDNLFDDLPSVKKGEKFYIKVDGEQHAYQIDRIEEVQKDELQRNFDTLKNRMKYNGETYELVINVKVNELANQNSVAKNQGTSIINKVEKDTNIITVYFPKIPVKEVQQNGKDVNGRNDGKKG